MTQHKAHARRKHYDVYVMDRSATAAEALKRIGELYAIEREIRGQPPDARARERLARAAPLLADLSDWLTRTQRTLSAKSPLAAAIQYSLTRWTALTRYVEDGRIEIDNNAAERAIRALVLGRRNYLFAGSDAGGETAARLYSLIGTCRLNAIDPHLYLRHVLECIANHPINRIEELLPWRVAPLRPLVLSHVDERRVRLNTLVEAGTRRFTYLYDFGDGWEHIIKVEDLVMPQPQTKRIRCLAGENACPPEDVGGPHAYLDFIAAIKDPAHEEHASMLEWIGGSFDPTALDMNLVNERLATIKA